MLKKLLIPQDSREATGSPVRRFESLLIQEQHLPINLLKVRETGTDGFWRVVDGVYSINLWA